MKVSKILLRLSLSFSILFYVLLAQDGSQLDGGGESIEPTGFEATLIDHSELSTDAIKTDPVLVGLHPDYWNAILNESSGYTSAKVLTYTQKIDRSDDTVTQNLFIDKPGGVLGIRMFFPEVNANSYVKIQPDRMILAHSEVKPNPFLNKGLIENVSVIKSITSFVFGTNFNYLFSIILRDQNNNKKEFPLGSLKYVGWKERTYTNAGYLSDIKDRKLKENLNYPKFLPFYAFDSYVVSRRKGYLNGNFITYVSWTKMKYDKFTPDEQNIFDHEAYWGIEKYKSKKLYEREQAKNRLKDDLIDMERKKMNLPPLERPNLPIPDATQQNQN